MAVKKEELGTDRRCAFIGWLACESLGTLILPVTLDRGCPSHFYDDRSVIYIPLNLRIGGFPGLDIQLFFHCCHQVRFNSGQSVLPFHIFAMPSIDQRKYDLIVLGATGHTGKLCAEYITRNLPTSLKWAVAGRSQSRLSSLLDQLEGFNPDRIQPGKSITL